MKRLKDVFPSPHSGLCCCPQQKGRNPTTKEPLFTPAPQGCPILLVFGLPFLFFLARICGYICFISVSSLHTRKYSLYFLHLKYILEITLEQITVIPFFSLKSTYSFAYTRSQLRHLGHLVVACEIQFPNQGSNLSPLHQEPRKQTTATIITVLWELRGGRQ